MKSRISVDFLKVMPHKVRAALREGSVLFLAVTLAWIPTGRALAVTAEAPAADTVRAQVKRLGVRQHVMVKLSDGKKLHGHIIAIRDRSFSLTTDGTRFENQVAYDEVVQIKKNPGKVVWIIVAIVAAVVVIAVVATSIGGLGHI